MGAFPIDARETDRLDPLDEGLRRDKVRLPEKILYCSCCADTLQVFVDPILPQNIQRLRCRHCCGIWLMVGSSGATKNIKNTRVKKIGGVKVVAALPQVYADPRSCAITETKGIFAYPRGG